MTPILGIMASAISGNLVTNSYESIATFTGSGNPNNVTFSSIPSTYKHLQLRMIVNSSASTGINDMSSMRIAFNADATTTNYREHYLRGDGATASAGTQAGTTGGFYMGAIAGGQVSASIFAATIVDILDYANTNKNKTVRCLCGGDANGSGAVALQSGGWFSTSAIDSIKILFGGNLTTASSIALYGIKG